MCEKGYIKNMIIFEILGIFAKTIWAILAAFFKAFVQLSELDAIKERVIAAGLGIPIQVLTVVTLSITAIKITTIIIKKFSL